MSGGTPPAGPGSAPGQADPPAGILADLEYLEFHWGSAYLLGHAGGQYTAVRRDGKGGTLTARTPEGLQLLIQEDYMADPVPRDLP